MRRLILLAVFVVVSWIAPTELHAFNQNTESGPTEHCGPIDPGTPCYVSGGGSYKCTGIGGCYKCVRDPFAGPTTTLAACKWVDDENGVCKCWNNPNGTCGSSGTCNYLRSSDPQ